jgi:hypothetical protein
MRNLTLTIQFCDTSQSFVSVTKYENTSIYLFFKDGRKINHHYYYVLLQCNSSSVNGVGDVNGNGADILTCQRL